MNRVSYAHLYAPFSLPHIYESTNKVNYRIYKTKPQDNVVPSAEYAVLNYYKDYMCIDEPIDTRQFRSVIQSYPEGELLSFSPPASIPYNKFCENYPDVRSDQIQVSEIIEGTLIHLFYDKRIQMWQIATRGAVGGQYYLFDKSTKEKHKTTTVYEMFLDALGISRNTDQTGLTNFLDTFPQFYSYSFVLQHPENRIILSLQRPALYLVGVYDIMPISMCLMSVPQFVYQGFTCFMDVPTIQFPKVYDVEEYGYRSYADLEKAFGFIQNNPRRLGIMITHLPSGNRTAIRNPVYAEIYKIRYLDTELQYQYLCLRRIGRVVDFLSYFPEYKGDFYRFYEQTRDFLENVHASYMSFYVFKDGVPTSLKYWPYIRRIHKEVYLPSLATGQEKKITRAVVHDFMNKFEPKEWLYALNYENRHLETDVNI